MRFSLVRALTAASAAALFLILGANSGAQDASPEASSAPSPAADTPAPTSSPDATPASSPAPPTPAPSASPSTEPVSGPAITPWPWPFPWLEAGTLPQGVAAAAGPVAPAAVESQARPPAKLHRGTPVVGDALSQAGDLGSGDPATVDNAPAEAPQPPESPLPAQPGAQISSGTSVAQVCDTKALEYSLSGEAGTIWSVVVRNSDCSWGGSQVLLGFDARGPPVIDLMTQSAGVNVDVGVYVAKGKVRMTMGYEGPEGLTRHAALELDPSARTIQTGENVIDLVQDADSNTGDALSGNQRLTLVVEGDAAAVHVMAQNASPGASAASGDAVSGNELEGQAGGSADAAGSQAGQTGDNDIDLTQDANARSGDALAGSQEVVVRVTGSVGDLAVLAQNASPDASAISGDAIATNETDVGAGPVAVAEDGAAQSGQVGDNRVRVDQSARATTGDAISGSQVIDVEVGGSVGEAALLLANDSDGAVAESGDALAENVLEVLVGPLAVSADGAATAAQLGDNDVRLDQFASAVSGSAVAGAQTVRWSIGGSVGKAVLMPVNNCAEAEAISGESDASNDAEGDAGPQAEGDATMVQHRGGNDVSLNQDLISETGDAVSGGQVLGLAA